MCHVEWAKELPSQFGSWWEWHCQAAKRKKYQTHFELAPKLAKKKDIHFVIIGPPGVGKVYSYHTVIYISILFNDSTQSTTMNYLLFRRQQPFAMHVVSIMTGMVSLFYI